MCDIDRAVEVATLQDFNAFTERHPFPADYEPEPEHVPYWPLDWVFSTVEAMKVRDAIVAERDAVMAASPLTGGCRELYQS